MTEHKIVETLHPKLYGKLAEVVAEVEGVSKSGTNTFFNYKYTTAEEMLRAIRGPLSSRHIALLPSVIDVAEREITTQKGGVSTVTTVRVSFTFVDGETGEAHRCEWAGQGDDPADKGLGKAYTNAVKTFLREAFLIPQGDDVEADARTDERAADRVHTPSRQSDGNGDRVASDKQQRLIAFEGVKAKLTPVELLNALRVGSGVAPVADIPDDDANAAAARILARLPARFVDGVLTAIREPHGSDIPSDMPVEERPEELDRIAQEVFGDVAA